MEVKVNEKSDDWVEDEEYYPQSSHWTTLSTSLSVAAMHPTAVGSLFVKPGNQCMSLDQRALDMCCASSKFMWVKHNRTRQQYSAE